ncbi:MAG: hypothetical protein EOO13_08845 [Chitinophagaceae bacterium]|nr:MAG: hypothetical protein EOO13_08845 [Chitinophagaceae bacterium]
MYKKILADPNNLQFLFGPGSEIDANILAKPNQYGYFRDESNFMIIRLTTIFCFFSFGKYMVINLFFALIAFSGIWKLYRFFVEQFPELERQFAIAILYLPTFTFWSSGILKDPVSIASLGWLTYAVYELVILKKGLIKNLLIILASVYLFSIVKIYILVAYLPAFVIFLLLKNAQLIKTTIGKIILVGGFLIGSVAGFSLISSSMQGAVVEYAGEDLTEGIVGYQKNYNNQKEKAEGSYFSLGVEFDGSLSSLAKVAPAAVVATFFRPFIWESRNVSTLLSSFESLALLLFTFYVLKKVGLRDFVATIFTKPIVLYCFIFAMVFALFVGATTLNFGTLVRYKIPCMPFFVISLFFILYFNKGRKLTDRKPKVSSN